MRVNTNGDARMDPMVVARAIGPNTARGAEPYHFLALPRMKVNGCVPIKQQFGEIVDDDANLFVDVEDSDTPVGAVKPA